MQEVRVQPRRCYRISLWAKTESLQPQNAFQITVLKTGDRSVSPRDFKLPETGNWQKLSFVFNSLTNQTVRIYSGVWGGKKGKLWLDNWSIEEVGPLNVLNRPGTPVTVENANRSVRYVEGKDYAPLVDPGYNPYRIDRSSPSLKILPGSNIKDGQTLHISWYHPMVLHESQINVCMGEPALYEVFDHEAKLLAEIVHPKRILLSMDEVRMGGTCEAYKKRNMAELLGECITRQTQILRRYLPKVEIAIWSDMLDPHHNAHGDYYLVEGDFTGSLKYVPKDLIIAVWGGKPRKESLQYFSDNHFRTWVACYYDADNLDEVKEWMDASRKFSNVSGFMYTPWEKKYRLLPDFGDLLY
jgi:hypothetical protein